MRKGPNCDYDKRKYPGHGGDHKTFKMMTST